MRAAAGGGLPGGVPAGGEPLPLPPRHDGLHPRAPRPRQAPPPPARPRGLLPSFLCPIARAAALLPLLLLPSSLCSVARAAALLPLLRCAGRCPPPSAPWRGLLPSSPCSVTRAAASRVLRRAIDAGRPRQAAPSRADARRAAPPWVEIDGRIARRPRRASRIVFPHDILKGSSAAPRRSEQRSAAQRSAAPRRAAAA